KELAIRRIAQWAINVVDSMDPDNIMTPFEYDVSPFTLTDPSNPTQPKNAYRSGWDPNATWAVDGQLDPIPSANPNTDDDKPWRRLVWGCEGQPLLITETMAIHDRRVADTDKDGGVGKKRGTNSGDDPTLDQVRIPEGSLFVELYATHNPNNP